MSRSLGAIVVASLVIVYIVWLVFGVSADNKEAHIASNLCHPYQLVSTFKQDGKIVSVCYSEDGGLELKQQR